MIRGLFASRSGVRLDTTARPSPLRGKTERWRPRALAKPAQAEPGEAGGADRARTGDPLVANQVLSQLSYSPEDWWA